MKIFLIRHGKPKVINNEFYKCHLSIEGIEETKKFAKQNIIPKPNLILLSPFNRAVDTAKVFSDYYKINFEIVDFLKEWNLQTLNLPFEEYNIEEEKGWKNQNDIVEGNESLNNVKERVLAGILKVIKNNPDLNTILLVCHGTVINMFCSVVSGRKATLSDIKNMKHLDYAIVNFANGELLVEKDIINCIKRRNK